MSFSFIPNYNKYNFPGHLNSTFKKQFKEICISLIIVGYTTSHREAALLWPAQGHLRRNVEKYTTPNPTGDFPVVPH